MALRTSPALLALLASYALLACPSLALLPILHDSNIVDENNLAEGMPQPLSLSNAVHLFQRLQQERQNGDMEDIMDQHGDPRLIGITDGGLYRGDLVVYLPVTFLLPTFAYRSRYSMAGKKESDWLSFLWGKSHSRSYGGSGGAPADIRGPVDQLLSNKVRYEPSLPEYQNNGDYGPLLSRLDAYFHYLRVYDDDCRMRTICQLARDPATYTPLSYLVLSALKKSESLSRPAFHSHAVFRFFRYYWAAERGAAGEDCRLTYYRCPAHLEDVVNMSVLSFWQRLASLVSIKLSDE
ncbi:uncharacterized protein LOC123518036 [Portunus trituberculatus]|uniref:uncharacterized protein LOC123518036 n=1 Tax=Portunus trituberculatus TaxID=210409 RepID=UPI001E1D1E31|nr:uncharacterized protein LOC123518036 [Portunus trituberculatus]